MRDISFKRPVIKTTIVFNDTEEFEFLIVLSSKQEGTGHVSPLAIAMNAFT